MEEIAYWFSYMHILTDVYLIQNWDIVRLGCVIIDNEDLCTPSVQVLFWTFQISAWWMPLLRDMNACLYVILYTTQYHWLRAICTYSLLSFSIERLLSIVWLTTIQCYYSNLIQYWCSQYCMLATWKLLITD